MPSENHTSFVTCGKVFEPEIPFELNPSEPPIVLGEVRINPEDFERPCVYLKFSEFIAFSLLGLNPQLSILYRLVRDDGTTRYPQILEEWAFEVDAAEVREAGDLVTSQPTVLSYCDCLDPHKAKKGNVTYRLEIAQIATHNVRTLDITNQSFIATLLNQAPEQRSSFSKDLNLPFMKCGKAFNPVLPLQLDKKDAPVKLAQVTVNLQRIQQPTCMLIDFSSFVTSLLREERFVDLAFALVRSCDGRPRPKVLQIWPFRRTFGSDMNIKEPVVFDFCDCLKSSHKRCTYFMYLIRARVSEQTSYDITNKSMNAQVYSS